jgi:hypothetical protein
MRKKNVSKQVFFVIRDYKLQAQNMALPNKAIIGESLN